MFPLVKFQMDHEFVGSKDINNGRKQVDYLTPQGNILTDLFRINNHTETSIRHYAFTKD